MDTMTNRCPDACTMMGRVVSTVVAPPAAMGANGPNHRASNGASRRVRISRVILASSATVPNSAPLYSVIKIEERE